MLKIKYDSHLIKREIVPTEQPRNRTRNFSQNAHDKLAFAVLYIGHSARLFEVFSEIGTCYFTNIQEMWSAKSAIIERNRSKLKFGILGFIKLNVHQTIIESESIFSTGLYIQ